MSHQIAMRLEHVARRELNTEYGGYGYVAHADYIEMVGGAYHVVIAVLAPYYKDAEKQDREKISGFIEKYRELGDKRIRESKSEFEKMTDELKELIEGLKSKESSR
jgi:hypothetical protein